MTAVELLRKKREGGELTRQEIGELIDLFMSGQLADYQMSAFLMAVFWRGLSEAETVALMEAMLHSGKVISWEGVPGPKVDKHSTGGVGDKVSICLAPLVAACGIKVPMVSGRGLGHTGGTVDKLEAIPGFRMDLDLESFVRVVRDAGACLIGQTAEMAPADRRIYALRDVTGTVESIPLIVASILCKKLAEGIDALVLDVKVGRGAFMQDRRSARRLARALARVGARGGKRVVALITDMSNPLGRTVGNALETREALELLRGKAPPDLLEVTLALGCEMLLLGGVARSQRQARAKLLDALRTGAATRCMEGIVAAQGGDPRVVTDPDLLPRAPLQIDVPAPAPGFVASIDALEVGLCAVAMGAGRVRAEQKVDPAVGIEILAAPGERVSARQPLARMHVREPSPELEARLARAFHLAARPRRPSPLILERIAPADEAVRRRGGAAARAEGGARS